MLLLLRRLPKLASQCNSDGLGNWGSLGSSKEMHPKCSIFVIPLGGFVTEFECTSYIYSVLGVIRHSKQFSI